MLCGRLLSYLNKRKISRNGHSLSFVVTHCHSLSLAVIRCTTRYHSLPLVVIRCTLSSLLNYLPYVPSCFTCFCALPAFVPYALSCLTRLRALSALIFTRLNCAPCAPHSLAIYINLKWFHFFQN